MDRALLMKILDNTTAGTRLKLTFMPGQGKKQVIDDNMKAVLCYFGMMAGKNLIFAYDMERATVMAVIQSGYWDSDRFRSFTVDIPENFDRDWFESRLCEGLESVEVVTPQGVAT